MYQTDVNRFKWMSDLTDLVDELRLTHDGREEGYLFASEFVIKAAVFVNDLQLANLNVSEKYAVKKRGQTVFDYVNLRNTYTEVCYLKLCVKDTVLACLKPRFYVCPDKEFLLMGTTSEMIRLENQQIL